jgi:type I restriction enzyme S subunit
VVVTGHFAVYEPDRQRILPEYFHRVIQAKFFKQHLWRNKVGAEGRKEVKLDFFESQLIPVPPLSVQRLLLEHWQKSQDAIRQAEASVVRIKALVLADFVTALGLKLPKEATTHKTFAVWWKDCLRWSVSYNEAARDAVDLTTGKYPIVKLGSILELVQYGTSEKANGTANGTPVIRINNIKDGLLDLKDLKHIPLSKKSLDNLRLTPGDILIIRTSGSRNLVGTCAVFSKTDEYVFASYLIRLRVKNTLVLPDFVSYFLNSPLGRQQINAVSRQIMQNNVNSEELRELDIPLPPLSVQEAIIKELAKGTERIAHEQETVANRSAEVTREVEEMILGQ